MAENGKLIFETFGLSEEYLNLVKMHKETYGQEDLDRLLRLKIIEKILIEKQQKPHLFIQIVKNFLFSISSQDPNTFHQDIARMSLSTTSEDKQDDSAIDLLAREILKECKNLEKKLRIPDVLQNYKKQAKEKDLYKDEKISYYLDFIDFPEANEDFEKQFFEKNGLSIWDNKYLKLLNSYGPEGKKRSKEFSNKLKQCEGGWNRQFWFKNPDISGGERFFHSPAIIILGCVLWEDVVKRRWNLKVKHVAALTTSVQDPISKILAPKNRVIERGNDIQIFHKDSLLGFVQVPTVPQNIISTVFNGMQKLNTVTGHRFIRYLVMSAFDRLVQGHSDHRVLELDRGASEIAELLGLNSNVHKTDIKEIIHAMAHCFFPDPQINGNLIQLSKYTSPKTKRKDEGYLITVGTPLLPYNTFETIKNGACGLLIPLLKDPPLVGSSRSHAGQYLIQMALMGEFSRQSVQFYKEGVIQITEKQLQQFAQACGLTPEVLIKIIDRWTQDGNDGAKFLERVDNDFFTLGIEYKKEAAFLKKQGELRVNRSNGGKASAVQKTMKKQGKNKKMKKASE